MRLLLTSGGLRNQTIIDSLISLTGKELDEIKIAFIPTAMNTEPGDKSWFLKNLNQLKDLGVGYIDIVDISALKKDVWLKRIKECNVLYVNGGRTTHLMECCNESGFTQELPGLLENMVYVGVSAGSYVTTPDIRFNSDGVNYVLDGFGLVDFGLQVHYKSPQFPLAKSLDAIKERAKGCPYKVYVLDDEMAVEAINDNHRVIGEGEYEVLLPT